MSKEHSFHKRTFIESKQTIWHLEWWPNSLISLFSDWCGAGGNSVFVTLIGCDIEEQAGTATVQRGLTVVAEEEMSAIIWMRKEAGCILARTCWYKVQNATAVCGTAILIDVEHHVRTAIMELWLATVADEVVVAGFQIGQERETIWALWAWSGETGAASDLTINIISTITLVYSWIVV